MTKMCIRDSTNLGEVSIPNTGDWQKWTTVSMTVDLRAGNQNFGIASPVGGYNLNWIKFTPVKNAAAKPVILVEAENYANMSGVQKEACSEMCIRDSDGTFPMIRGILNSLIVSGCSAAICTYFSSLTAYGLYAYDFKFKKAAFTFIMAILVMPTQVTAMGFLRLITNIGMYDSLLPLIIPSIASPAVCYFMYSYLQSSLPLSLVEAARIDG